MAHHDRFQFIQKEESMYHGIKHILSKEKKGSYSHDCHKLSKQLHSHPVKANKNCMINIQIQQPKVTGSNQRHTHN